MTPSLLCNMAGERGLYLWGSRVRRWQGGKLSLCSFSGRRLWVCCLLLPAAVSEDRGLGLEGGRRGGSGGLRGVHYAARGSLHGKRNGAAVHTGNTVMMVAAQQCGPFVSLMAKGAGSIFPMQKAQTRRADTPVCCC